MDIITYALAKKMIKDCSGDQIGDNPIDGDQAQVIKAEIQEIKVDIEAIKEDLKDNVEATPLEYNFRIIE